jgi:glycosyltransferase involved in cell wall biosynthesis
MTRYNPLVSIIIPMYNSAHTISDTIHSVMAQTYDNYEIILVDDGSTDTTKEVIRHYDDAVTYVYQVNGGPSSARNTGIKRAKGDLIAFLDADDVWVPHKLSKQVEMFADNPQLGLCASACNNCNSDLEIEELHDICPTSSQRIWKEMLVQNLFATPTVVVRRECFDKAGLFNESFGFAEDWDMWLRIVSCHTAAYSNEPLCLCRRLDNGLTKTVSPKKMQDWETIIKLHKSRFNGLYAKTIGYYKAMSWYYFNCAYYYQSNARQKCANTYLLKSLLIWPFNMPRRYKGLIHLFF